MTGPGQRAAAVWHRATTAPGPPVSAGRQSEQEWNVQAEPEVAVTVMVVAVHPAVPVYVGFILAVV